MSGGEGKETFNPLLYFEDSFILLLRGRDVGG